MYLEYILQVKELKWIILMCIYQNYLKIFLIEKHIY